jgi:heterodisulfide reductase subunit C
MSVFTCTSSFAMVLFEVYCDGKEVRLVEEKNLKQGLFKQEVLHKLESLCTQEELPACNAACPIHVDMKSIMKSAAQGDFKGAYTMYAKVVPFPRIIAYSCDAPCQKACKRMEIGGAVNIRDLETAAVNFGFSERKKLLFLPKNSNRISIVGGGLRGLTAAYDLVKKGYKITIYEKSNQLGGSLWDIPEEKLPRHIIEEDIEELLKYPINIKYQEEVLCDTIEQAEEFLKISGDQALYISCRTSLFTQADENTLMVNASPVFTGSRTLQQQSKSTISEIFDGRSAATSIDRAVKNVSVMAGREKEGAYETKLFTNTSQYPFASPVEKASAQYSREEATEEAKRCIQCECLECVKGCAFMQHYKSYPKKFVRETYNNLSIPIGTHHANKPINNCNACGQCESICPNGLSMADVYLAARSVMVDTKKMPQSAHEFAMLDMEYSNGEDYFMAKNQKGFENSAYMFFPSCQLSASEPELTEVIYGDLCERLEGGVGIMLACCSIIAKWAGETKVFEENLNQLIFHWEQMGKPKVITACPTCGKTLAEHTDMEVVGIWELLKDKEPAENAAGIPQTMVVHDACSSRYDEKTQEDIRGLAYHLGYQLEEIHYSKKITPCCGYGGLTPFADRELANEITKKRTVQTERPFLTYCVNCRDRFLKEGKESYHILELLYGEVKGIRRISPTWSERQENRASVKQSLLKNQWGIEIMPKENVELFIRKELEQILEERMILRSNISDAILHGEKMNERFLDPKTNCYITSYKPKNVTFWVVYKPRETGYEIINAYSHRMTLEKRPGQEDYK